MTDPKELDDPMSNADSELDPAALLEGTTPGPWRASVMDAVTYDDGTDCGKGWIGPVESGSPPVLTAPNISTANARLIASAPALATALLEAVSKLEESSRRNDELADELHHTRERIEELEHQRDVRSRDTNFPTVFEWNLLMVDGRTEDKQRLLRAIREDRASLTTRLAESEGERERLRERVRQLELIEQTNETVEEKLILSIERLQSERDSLERVTKAAREHMTFGRHTAVCHVYEHLPRTGSWPKDDEREHCSCSLIDLRDALGAIGAWPDKFGGGA